MLLGNVKKTTITCLNEKLSLISRHQRMLFIQLIYSAYESRENLDSVISLSILSEMSQAEYVRQRQNSKKEF